MLCNVRSQCGFFNHGRAMRYTRVACLASSTARDAQTRSTPALLMQLGQRVGLQRVCQTRCTDGCSAPACPALCRIRNNCGIVKDEDMIWLPRKAPPAGEESTSSSTPVKKEIVFRSRKRAQPDPCQPEGCTFSSAQIDVTRPIPRQ